MDGMQLPGGSRAGRCAGAATMGYPGEQLAGRKRKGTPPEDAKSRLSQGAQLVLSRPLMKGDIIYKTWITEDGSGTFSASVCLPEYDPTTSYLGLTAPTKKQAE